MAYKRFPPEKVPVNIWEFRSSNQTTWDDLVKIRFENGEYVFVAQRAIPNTRNDLTWQIDNDLMPVALLELKAKNAEEAATFNIPRGSGYVGKLLRLDMAMSYWREELSFTTDSPIKSIKPARRPRNTPTLALSGEVKRDYIHHF